ncbi:ankyrin repeat domain protein [Nitzschia inconspicua]|uniref:Ankyrin repeat domain protein n=1 Tax=Nitzschia inconspicua TaxID=303405 RepID=A0A9K3M279_9STRA|nr:ankyrin repeat domain protein [Nitzschia inconspicua]
MRHLLTDLSGNPIYTSFGTWRGTNDRLRSSSPHHNPQSLLFLYITSASWNDAIRRAQSHPQEILYIDDNGNTPLHRACQLDPPAEVLHVLQDAVTQTNSLGATPLHIAASHRCNARTLRELIDLYPGALCQCSRMGRTPIHYACMSYRGLDLVAFQVLLEKTLEESRRKQQEYQLEQDGNDDDAEGENQDVISGGESDGFKITDFIDIVREAKEGDIQDDEEISVLMGDGDSQFAMGVSGHSSSSWMMQTRSTNDGFSTLGGEDGTSPNNASGNDDDQESPDKNQNFNVVTWKDNTGNTPLGLLFRRYRERVRSVITVLEQMRNGASTTPRTTTPTSLQTDLGHLWGKARLIVARLTEEQQQQEHEQNLAFASRAEQQQFQTQKGDDASSVGQQHWTAAASWSKERFTGNNGTPVMSQNHVRASAVASAMVREDVNREIIKTSSSSSSSECEDDDDVKSAAKEFEMEPREFRIVHASVGLTGYGCPPEMIRLAISIHPHQVREMDEDGNLPLHIAASASSFGTLSSNIGMKDEEASVFSDGMASLFSTGSTKRNKSGDGNFDTVIKMLLKQYPQAAQTPHGKSGRLPLVLAARAGHRSWDDGMKTLLRAYPPALFSGSKGMIPVKLYPHALALIGGGDPLPPPNAARSLSLNKGSNHSGGNGLKSSTHSYGHTRVKGRGGMAFLHNLLLLKQRHIHELAGTATQLSEGAMNVNSPFRPTRHRNHVYSVPLSSGSGHRPRSRNSSWSRKKPASKTPPRTKVDPKLATTMFELLRTKPDLVEVGRSYHEKLERERRQHRDNADSKPSPTFSASAQGHQGDITRGKRTMSRSLLERMTVFERKAWK